MDERIKDISIVAYCMGYIGKSKDKDKILSAIDSYRIHYPYSKE